MGKIFIYLLSKGEGAGKDERDGFEPGLIGGEDGPRTVNEPGLIGGEDIP